MIFFDVVIIPISDQIGIPIPVLMSMGQGDLLKGIDNKLVHVLLYDIFVHYFGMISGKFGMEIVFNFLKLIYSEKATKFCEIC